MKQRRSFAGYTCRETLSVGLFGETFLGQNKRGVHARIVLVDGRLAQRKRFASALARYSTGLADLVHPHVVTTRVVGRGRDGGLVVITSPVEDAIDLRGLLEQRGLLPRSIALSIAQGALRGLSHAHDHQVVHGGVHPRSIVVDRKGVAKLSDFGLAHSLAIAAAAAEDSELLAGLRGYVAPELALGQEPDFQSDVYAAGSLLSKVLWNSTSPPANEDSELARVVRRATSTNVVERFADAGELEAALRRSLENDRVPVASTSDVADFTRRIDRRLTTVDKETEELLASLDTNQFAVPSSNVDDTEEDLAKLDFALSKLEDSPDAMDDEATDFAPNGEVAEVPVQQDAALPTAHPPSVAAEDEAVPGDKDTHKVQQDTASSFDLPTTTVVVHPSSDEHLALSQRRKNLYWVAVIAFALAMVLTVGYTQTDWFTPGRRAAQERDLEVLREESLQALVDSQPQPGAITISSDVADAAVWILLGRTPAKSFPLSSSRVHELLVEHDGFEPAFVSVAAQHWSGNGNNRKAEIAVRLVPATQPQTAPKAFPPTVSPPLAPGGSGQGPLTVHSEPKGAQVWLWVGTTPTMTMSNIHGGVDYEFRIVKDGHLPAFATIRKSDWYLNGTSGPMRPSIVRSVALTPTPKQTRKKKTSRRKKNTKYR